MERTIWKFPLAVSSFSQVEMPVTSEILSLQVQDGYPCIWALVYPDATKEIRTFATYGTGHNFPPPTEIKQAFIGTYQLPGLVYHVFETDTP